MREPLDLSTAAAKFERAQLHAKELLDHVRVWTHNDEDPAIRVGLEDDLKNRRTLAYVESVKDIPSDWSLILGDALHDYRAALNYVIGALIVVGRIPGAFDDPDSEFQFPVCDTTRTDFFKPSRRRARGQLPGVHVKHLRALSPFQPYKRRRERWILCALKELNDLDKHREPLLATHHVQAQIAVVSASFGDAPPVATFKSLRPRGRLEPGAKLAHIVWLLDEPPIILVPPFGPSPSQPDVTMRFQPVPGIVLEDLLPRVVLVPTFFQEADALVEAVIRKVREI